MKILIADDHDLFREGLSHILEQMRDDLTILEAADFTRAIATIEGDGDIAIMLMDLSMPGGDWAESLARLREMQPELRVIILSASDDRSKIFQALNLGAAGFISKTSSSRVLISALQLVLAGGVYLPPALLLQGEDSGAAAQRSGGATFLTPRQREVLALLGKGQSNKEIARVLKLAEGTVKLHVTAILKALNVNNRTRAVVAAAQLDLPAPGGV